MRCFFILIIFTHYFISSVATCDSKWNLNPEISKMGFETFTEFLIDIFDIMLTNKRDLVVTDGGRKLSNRFTDVISKRGQNVIMFCSYSYIINNLKIFERLLRRHEYSLLILSDWDDSNLMDFLDALRYQNTYIVIAFYNGVSDSYLQAVTEKCLREGLLRTLSIVNKRNEVEIIRGAYRTSSLCKTEIVLEKLEWSLRNDSIPDIFNIDNKIDMQGCTLNISTISIPPNVIVDKENKLPISGYETKMIHVLGKDMNFTPNINVYSYLVWGGLHENGSIYGILGEVYGGKSEIAYGVIWPTSNRKALFDLSFSFENDCFGWAVPTGGAISSLHRSLTGYLTDGFGMWSWVCIILSAVCICLLYGLHALLYGNDRAEVFEALAVGFLFTISSLVQKGVFKSYLIPRLSLRIVFIAWLFCTLVIATIYNGILEQRFVFPDVDPDLNTLEELLDSNLPLITSHDVYRSIHDIDSNETLYNMVKQRIKMRSLSAVSIPRLVKGKKLAYCRNLETLYYYRDKMLTSNVSHPRNPFHIMKDCFLTYPLVIALRKGSALTRRTNVIISRLVETGFLGHWKHRRVDVTKLLPSFQPGKIEKLRYIFYFYFIGMSLATIVFIIEVLYKICTQRWKYEYCRQEFYFDFKN